jgi:mercuric ion binding protein
MRYRPLTASVAIAVALLSWPVHAEERTVVLDIKNADCVLCPPIVRRSLMRVPGVNDVKISQASQMENFVATIQYDDAVANDATLIAATTKAGFPSNVVSQN